MEDLMPRIALLAVLVAGVLWVYRSLSQSLSRSAHRKQRKAVKQSYAQGGPSAAAAQQARSGNHATAARLYTEAGQHGRAGREYVKAGVKDKAAASFEKNGDLGHAGRLYIELGQLEKGAGLLERAGDQPEQAAKAWEAAGRWDRAAEQWTRAGNHQAALKANRRSPKAVDTVFDRLQQAIRAEADGSPPQRLLYRELADEAKKQHLWEVAADAYQQAGDLRAAAEATAQFSPKQSAELWESIGDLNRAAALFEQAQSYASASALYIDGGDVERGIGLIEQAGGRGAVRMARAMHARRRGDTALAQRMMKELEAEGMSGVPGPPIDASVDGTRYLLKEELGRGGMAVVYRALDTKLQRDVALKFLSHSLSDRPHLIDYFLREARSAGRLNHENIIIVYDFGKLDGQYFISMELVPGRPLSEMFTPDDPLPIGIAAPIFSQVCQAITYAHDEGILHRDLKPSNILIGENGVVKVLDFGLARPLPEKGEASMAVGTPAYMAPEQSTGRADKRSDYFALGVSMYQVLLGRRPGYPDVLPQSARDIPHPDQVLTAIPRPLSHQIMRLLEHRPDDRPDSLHELVGVLDDISVIRPRPTTVPEQTTPKLDAATLGYPSGLILRDEEPPSG